MEDSPLPSPAHTWTTDTDDSRDGRDVMNDPSGEFQGSTPQFDYSCSSSDPHPHSQTRPEPEVFLPNYDVPSSASDDPSLLTCVVCSDVASGRYFGAVVCLPCKSFYIRCTKEGQPVFSTKCFGDCDVTKQSRIRCQSCRYQKCLSAGMTRREKPVYISPVNGQSLCCVCGDLANGIHFGVYTCEGCKKFFRRGMLEYNSYLCKKNNQCAINPRSRNTCRSCRYRKCINVGMSRQAIKMGRPKKRMMSSPEISRTSGNQSRHGSRTLRTVDYSVDMLPTVHQVPLTYGQSVMQVGGHHDQTTKLLSSVGGPPLHDGPWSPSNQGHSWSPKPQNHQWISEHNSGHDVEQWIRNHHDVQWPKNQVQHWRREQHNNQWVPKHQADQWTPNHENDHWPRKHNDGQWTSKHPKVEATVMNIKSRSTHPSPDTTCGHEQMETETETDSKCAWSDGYDVDDNQKTDIEMASSPGPIVHANEATSNYWLTNDEISSMLQFLESLGKMEQPSDANDDEYCTKRLECNAEGDRNYKSNTHPQDDAESDGVCSSNNEGNMKTEDYKDKPASSPEQPKQESSVDDASSSTLAHQQSMLATGLLEKPDSPGKSPCHHKQAHSQNEATKCQSPVFNQDKETGAVYASTSHSADKEGDRQVEHSKTSVSGKWYRRVEENYTSPLAHPKLKSVSYCGFQSSSRIYPECMDLRCLHEVSKTLQAVNEKHYGSSLYQRPSNQASFDACTCEVGGQISNKYSYFGRGLDRREMQNGRAHQFPDTNGYPYHDCLNVLQSIKGMECLASAPGIWSSAVRQMRDTFKVLLLCTEQQLAQSDYLHNQE